LITLPSLTFATNTTLQTDRWSFENNGSVAFEKVNGHKKNAEQKRLAEKQQPVQHHIHVDGKNINSLIQQGRFSISN
jgi:hypothetical protein